jgi:hypothetical protein
MTVVGYRKNAFGFVVEEHFKMATLKIERESSG